MSVDKTTVPFWMAGTETTKLTKAAAAWFKLLRTWAQWPAQQMDPTTCSERVLNLIAWQRDIDRFSGEPLSLFRLRVKYAYANAKDAGSVVGFKRIFKRLGIGDVTIKERMDGRDWDIVALTLTDLQISENQSLLEEIIQHYGRTCRRYEWTVQTVLPAYVRAYEFNNSYTVDKAAVPPCTVGVRVAEFSTDFVTM